MKKLMLTLALLMSVIGGVMAQTRCITICESDERNVSFLNSQIDEIRYLMDESTGEYIQEVQTKGVVYRFGLTEKSSMCFDNVDVSGVCVYKENIGDWEEMRMMADGSLFLQKANQSNSMWKDIVLLLSNEEAEPYLYTVILDENDMPRYVTINNCIVKVNSYDTDSIDISIAYNDTITQSFANLEWQDYSMPVTRAWSENNWQRNLAGVIEVAAGAAGVVAGALTIAGSVVSEAGTLGASTPISVPGIALGATTIAGGCSTFRGGFDKLFKPGESRSDLVGNIANQAVGTALQNERVLSLVPDKYFPLLKDPNYRPSNGLFVASLGAGIFDNLFGRTVTWEDIAAFYSGKVLTGICTDITTNSVTLRGYVYPEVTRSPLNGAKFENEYGIILSSAQGNSSNVVQKTTNGDGGIIEFAFNDLKPNTSYNYQAYYFDRTNTIFQRGETRSFKTQSIIPHITNFKVTKSSYDKGSYSNDGRTYDYKFDVETTVEIESLEGIADWGYVYKDPYGQEKRISLMGHGTSYTDTRYAYFRNESKSTACLYGYVKYEGDNEYYYGEPHEYPLEHSQGLLTCPDSNHPHAIDLGLPSGTKWACCNVGASSPEQYGGYYAWGETSEKSVYNVSTYQYYKKNVGYINIGSDIAGSSYDVAHVRMGGSWRMPSKEQWLELMRYCTQTWTKQNGVNGILLTGKNGGQLFLPAAGRRWGSDLLDAGSNGYNFYGGRYWSSLLDPNKVDVNAHFLGFDSDSRENVYWQGGYMDRGYGNSVRAVCP